MSDLFNPIVRKESPHSIISLKIEIISGKISVGDSISLNTTTFIIENINDDATSIIIKDYFSKINLIQKGEIFSTNNDDRVKIVSIIFKSKC